MDLLSTIFDRALTFVLVVVCIILPALSMLGVFRWANRFYKEDDEQSEGFDKIIINIRHVKESEDEDDNS